MYNIIIFTDIVGSNYRLTVITSYKIHVTYKDLKGPAINEYYCWNFILDILCKKSFITTNSHVVV